MWVRCCAAICLYETVLLGAHHDHGDWGSTNIAECRFPSSILVHHVLSTSLFDVHCPRTGFSEECGKEIQQA